MLKPQEQKEIRYLRQWPLNNIEGLKDRVMVIIKQQPRPVLWVKRLLFLSILLNAQFTQAQADVFTLNADEWARPRSGDTIVKFKPLVQMLDAWSRHAGAAIEVRYPGGDEGSLWAQELSDWLVALGVPAKSIRTTPGSARVDEINLIVIQP